MLENYLEDYYKGKINGREISKELGISYYKFEKTLKEKGLKSYVMHFEEMNTGDEELDRLMRKKYSSIVDRCNGGHTDKYGKYNGMDYLNVIEYVEFCNDNKKELLDLWNIYLENDRELKYAISVDRINDDKGYTVDNIEFVTHGFNAWKRSIDRPIKAKRVNENEWKYFMSCAEGSVSYGLRHQVFGEILRKVKYHRKDFDVIETTVEEVLKNNGVRSVQEYYDKFILQRGDKR